MQNVPHLSKADTITFAVMEAPDALRRLEAYWKRMAVRAVPTRQGAKQRKGDWAVKYRMDYKLAMAIGQDAANLRMRKAGRTSWNEDDYNAACDAQEKALWMCDDETKLRCFGTTVKETTREAGR